MAETQQVLDMNDSSSQESPEPQTSRSGKRRFKASNMAFQEMVEMVGILRSRDYDGKHGPYTHPNLRKARIMAKVVKTLHNRFGVRRSKDQLRKRWSDLKLREPDQYRRIKKVLKKREKSLTKQDPRDRHPCQQECEVSPIPPVDVHVEEGEVEEGEEMGTPPGDVVVVESDTFPSTSAPPEDVEEGEVEEGEVEEVGEMGTPPGDVLFVERAPFSSDSAQRLIGQIMGWNGELDDMRTSLDLMKTQIDNMQLEMKNMIDILGRI